MTDNEIIKALECCIRTEEKCDECPYWLDYARCSNALRKDALDLINRQRAEIEELEAEIDKQHEQAKADILGNMADGGTSCHWCIEQHRAIAVKEFAERLKATYQDCKFPIIRNINARRFNDRVDYCIAVLDKIAKEMVGEQG